MKKEPDENDEQFIWRVCQHKDTGMSDITWDDVANIINRELGIEESPYASSSFRKQYQQAKRFYEAGVFSDVDDVKILEEIRAQRHELEMEKVRVRDERNELRRVIREESRRRSLEDQIVRAISECECGVINSDDYPLSSVDMESDNDMIITLTDLHTGIQIDNFCNTFDNDVLKWRLDSYADKVIEIKDRHCSENAYVIISEIVNGIIHNPLRIESNQTVIEQFITAVNYISEFLVTISAHFNDVHVVCCPGNHSRVIANKDNSLKGENLDHLVIPFLSAKLQNFNNIHCEKNEIEESIAIFNVRNNVVMAAHGDKDEPSNVVQKFTMMFNDKPDFVYLSHRHTNAMSTVYDTKVITSGCMSGSDSYCMDKRLRNRPEQVISIITKSGLECNYDVRFF